MVPLPPPPIPYLPHPLPPSLTDPLSSLTLTPHPLSLFKSLIPTLIPYPHPQSLIPTPNPLPSPPIPYPHSQSLTSSLTPKPIPYSQPQTPIPHPNPLLPPPISYSHSQFLNPILYLQSLTPTHNPWPHPHSVLPIPYPHPSVSAHLVPLPLLWYQSQFFTDFPELCKMILKLLTLMRKISPVCLRLTYPLDELNYTGFFFSLQVN